MTKAKEKTVAMSLRMPESEMNDLSRMAHGNLMSKNRFARIAIARAKRITPAMTTAGRDRDEDVSHTPDTHASTRSAQVGAQTHLRQCVEAPVMAIKKSVIMLVICAALLPRLFIYTCVKIWGDL